ncbi:hypothetical protein [Peristeroidobacter soli]|uniref:hypothetical protein n=1 Tax=Peristeroidobacter soli TaxID=2497877 RepID=UPI00101CC459|nr:hypothetical protein [Peristeroidobacter soli]
MKAAKASARRERAQVHAPHRRMQTALAVAKCIEIAADHPDEHQQLDLADAVAGLSTLVESAIAMLGQSESRT